MSMKIQAKFNIEVLSSRILRPESLAVSSQGINPTELSDICTSAIAKALISIKSAYKRVPFLYHITPVSNLKAITEEGLHVNNNIMDPLKRLYFFDKKNFIAAWSKAQNGQMSEADMLLCSYIFRNEDLAILKVPTNKLNPKKLALRSYSEMKRGKSGIHHFDKTPAFLDRNDIIEFTYNGNIPPEYIENVGVVKAIPTENLSDFTRISDGLIHALS